MEYALFNGSKIVKVTSESPYTGTPALKEFKDSDGNVIAYDRVVHLRNNSARHGDIRSYDAAKKLAEQITEFTGELHIGYEHGDWTSDMFGVIKAPAVGDECSMGFNGDYYPVGRITRITTGWRVYTIDANGKKHTFNRRKNSSSWKEVGSSPFHMVQGHHDERNPSF